jgi:hypothetical protein
MIARIQDELPRRSSDDETRIKLAIIDSIEFYRTKKFFFNQITDEFTTTIGEEAYGTATAEGGLSSGYDDDLFGIDQLYADDAGGNFTPVDEWVLDVIRLQNHNTSVGRGYPDYYAWFNKQIYFSPVPHVAYDVRIDGIKDVGTPVVTTSSGVHAFFEPGGTVPLADSYTNEWFTEAQELIRLHAKIDLAENVFHDDRTARRLADREDRVLIQLKSRLRAFNKNTYLVPYS